MSYTSHQPEASIECVDETGQPCQVHEFRVIDTSAKNCGSTGRPTGGKTWRLDCGKTLQYFDCATFRDIATGSLYPRVQSSRG